jgi:N-methylhydantoinase A/acetophenone carboxylase
LTIVDSEKVLEAPEDVRNTMDIDVGGTFTDMVMVVDGETIFRKVPTTPYDLSVCFMQAVEAGAQAFGTTVDELMPKMEMVRYSTTVAMNRLIERKGPRIGLIATEGHEDAVLIGLGAQWIDGTRLDERRALPHMSKPDPLVLREMIVGVKERVDGTGAVIRPIDEEDVRRKVRKLVDNGRGRSSSRCYGRSSTLSTSARSRRSSARSTASITSDICR